MKSTPRLDRSLRPIALAAALALATGAAPADAITDWNLKADELITEAKLGTPPAIRVMAIVQTAVLRGRRTPCRRNATGADADGAAVDAAVAAAHRAALAKLMPAQQAAIDAAYQAALATDRRRPGEGRGHRRRRAGRGGDAGAARRRRRRQRRKPTGRTPPPASTCRRRRRPCRNGRSASPG